MKGVPAPRGSPDSIILAGQSAAPSWGTGSTGVVTMYPRLSRSIVTQLPSQPMPATHGFIAYRTQSTHRS